MKAKLTLLLPVLTIISFNLQANGDQGGRTLSSEVKCELKKGQVQQLPPLYCKMFNGKAL
ncbi:hypothetical protein GCM10007938_05380 [Vibrio zhanjiangensis]|uniref:Uncharacterized protein n=1 Tax=Vibrio zhanjiangensis TaxID=1046128 RepID=A0ABQ6EUC2_9VIBR|nr:hypothetical protein [Vibrio zhanjiangensis]GLT16762.1 hypothetical protein GCM10007938_05380 [Vibrio zhanjiangensis]